MSTEDNIALVRRYLDEVVHTGKMGVDSSLLAPDHVAHSSGSPPVQGQEDWKQGAVALYSAFPDIHVTFEDEMAMGDKVVIRWTVRATHTGALRNIPATGKPVTWTGITIVRVADGKIVEQWQEVDLLGLMQQLGAISSMGESGQANATLIQTLIHAFNTKDVDRYAANATADCETLDVPNGRTFSGPDGYRQFVQSYLTAFPDGQVQATRIFTTDDQGLLEYIGRGTNTGPFPYSSGQIPPTGRRVEFRVCAVLQFRDGKVASVHYYYDQLSVLQQLGLVPTKDGTLVPIS